MYHSNSNSSFIDKFNGSLRDSPIAFVRIPEQHVFVISASRAIVALAFTGVFQNTVRKAGDAERKEGQRDGGLIRLLNHQTRAREV
jgi:hypothetical protein